MCGGGGGYDPGPGESEAERDYEEAIRQINAIFGYTPEATGVPTAPLPFNEWQAQNPTSTPTLAVTNPRLGRRDQRLYDRYVTDFDQENQGPYGYQDFGFGYTLPSDPALAATAAENRVLIDQSRDATRGDTMNFLTEKLNRLRDYDLETVNRGVRSRGLSGGSDSLEARRRMLERYDDTLLDIGNTADTAINNITAADEASRVNLINNIRAGMDATSASGSAKSQLTTNANQAFNEAKSTQFGDVFGDIRDLYAGYQVAKGRSSAPQPGSRYGAFYPGGSSGSGSVKTYG